MLLALFLPACTNSKIPDEALFYDVTVTATEDECHPDSEEGYVENFRYAVAFDGSKATLWIDESVFAVGTITGCDLTYTTVVFGEETEDDGEIKWQLTGSANVDPAEGDACVEGEGDWEGTETFEVISSVEETLEPGCEYLMDTVGNFVAGE